MAFDYIYNLRNFFVLVTDKERHIPLFGKSADRSERGYIKPVVGQMFRNAFAVAFIYNGVNKFHLNPRFLIILWVLPQAAG
jgi:hypothetical protein